MLARANRLLRPDEFRATSRRGSKSVSNRGVCFVLRQPDSPARFGFIVSRAFGGSVARNLIKRRLRAAARELVGQGAAGAWLVYRPFPAAAEASLDELRTELARALARD